ncbi:MAG: hypothetical protein RR547_01065, partial [Raoultibacter sp.]
QRALKLVSLGSAYLDCHGRFLTPTLCNSSVFECPYLLYQFLPNSFIANRQYPEEIQRFAANLSSITQPTTPRHRMMPHQKARHH